MWQTTSSDVGLWSHREILEYVLPKKFVRSEIARFKSALKLAKSELRGVKEKIPKDTASDITAFIDTHLLMLEDSALTDLRVMSTVQALLQKKVFEVEESSSLLQQTSNLDKI